MCNIAGYVGKRSAAQILIEMIQRQEGLNGGFFTGIATHNGKRIEYRKKQGDTAYLLNQTDAKDLCGNTGIMHSRTPDGGNDLWAHPFYTEREGVVKMCYVANGGLGIFRHNNADYNIIADRLVANGFDIPCKLNLESHKYNRLFSGEAVHMSDVMCQLIYSYKVKGNTTAEAMREAYSEMPGEIVGLAIENEYPDRIFFSRINKPMFLGFDDSGAYVASSPIAFPPDIKEYKLIPPLSSGTVFCDRVEICAYSDFSMTVTPFDEETVQDAEKVILSLLKDAEAGIRDMFKAISKTLPSGALTQSDAIVYSAVSSLLDKGKIKMRLSTWMADGKAAPKTLFALL